MKWDAIGAIAELVGALGVIASLLYLAGHRCRPASVISSTPKSVTYSRANRRGE